MPAKEKTKTKIKKRSNMPVLIKGKLFVKATFNNTIATLTDIEGNVVGWNTSGRAGFKGSRKSTPFAATSAIETLVKQGKQMGLKQVEIYIKGPGPGRDAVLRVLRGQDVRISMIADVTPIPHNGPRPKKRRRV